mmetsp:Transcript_80798/g.130960  ORF Transcript_80798/g.130960 Transcript_80798/m.130960 type:complete len:139 (+) Transcript_80798:66-482(+)
MSDKRICVVLKPDGSHEQIEYEYTDDWQDKVLGGKMLELGEISPLNVMVGVMDPDAPGNGPNSEKLNTYEMPDPQPKRVGDLRKEGKLFGDILVYNGDGDFQLDRWIMYKENPEDFDVDEDDDEDEEEDDKDDDDDDE